MEVREEMDASLDRCIRRWVRPLILADSEGNVWQLMDDEIWRTTEPERKRIAQAWQRVCSHLIAPVWNRVVSGGSERVDNNSVARDYHSGSRGAQRPLPNRQLRADLHEVARACASLA
jgi:hypothetical protein